MEHTADNTGKRVGMWLFLYTELMLFGGLFVIYANYYHRYTEDDCTWPNRRSVNRSDCWKGRSA